MFSSKSLYL